MGKDGWLQRQRCRRLFFIGWGVFLMSFAAPQIGVPIALAADHDPFHALPLWIFPLDVIGSAWMARTLTRRNKQLRNAR
jgi:hypothetical protein